MASRGFEFAYDLSGGGNHPMVFDFTVGEGTAYVKGDLVCLQTDGYVDKLTTSIGEVTGVVAEALTSAEATASSTNIKVAIATPTQVWKCSMDASTATTAIVGYTKTLDTNDANTIDAADITNGSLILLDKTNTDDEGNILAYVTFASTTFGRSPIDTDTT